MGTPEDSKTKKPEPDSRDWWFQVANGLGMDYVELKQKLDRAEQRIKSIKLGGETLKATLREAESYIFELRGALLFYFGTTDPELLADVWKGSAEAHDAALATERLSRERAERTLEAVRHSIQHWRLDQHLTPGQDAALAALAGGDSDLREAYSRQVLGASFVPIQSSPETPSESSPSPTPDTQEL